MKICIVQGAFLPVPAIHGGAVEKIWYRMGQEFVRMGHEVVHIGKADPKLAESEVVKGVKYKRIKGYETQKSLLKLKFLDLLYSVRVVAQIPKDSDVIVTNTFWLPILLRGDSGRKVYVDVQRVPKGQMRFYQHCGVLRGCSPAICGAIRKELPEAGHGLVHYVPNPVPFDVVDAPDNKGNVILFVGRLHPEKGVDVLIEAFRILSGKASGNWSLDIVGPSDVKDGGGGDQYLETLRSKAAGLNVVFHGSVFGEEALKKHFARASVFCYPAQEGSGDAAPVAPREAMAYGAVPVVSELPCFDDIIHNGVNGIRYDHRSADQAGALAESLLQLVLDETYRASLSNKARAIMKDYSSAAIASRFVVDFEGLATSGEI